MRKIKQRIPEGGAIEDSNKMTMEQYSSIMKTTLVSRKIGTMLVHTGCDAWNVKADLTGLNICKIE